MVEKVTEKDDKELKIQGHKANIRNVEEELDKILIPLRAEQARRIELLEKKIELNEKLHPIALNNFKRLEGPWAFMMDEEYQAIQKDMAQIDHELELINLRQNLVPARKQLEDFDKQIESLKKSKETLTKDIEELQK